MKERPILFKASMVRALLDGSKTQMRRALKVQPWSVAKVDSGNHIFDFRADKADLEKIDDMRALVKRCPYGQPGDRLWVRETWNRTNPGGSDGHCFYRASDEVEFPDAIWKPSIHMPRWASRIALEVTGVRVERLQAINEMDAIMEGAEWSACGAPQEGSYKAGYAQLWEQINGPDSWAQNPWVWVVEFKIAKDTK